MSEMLYLNNKSWKLLRFSLSKLSCKACLVLCKRRTTCSLFYSSCLKSCLHFIFCLYQHFFININSSILVKPLKIVMEDLSCFVQKVNDVFSLLFELPKILSTLTPFVYDNNYFITYGFYYKISHSLQIQ